MVSLVQDDDLEDDKVLIDNVGEIDVKVYPGKLLLDGINSESLGENEPLATENAGRRIY